MPAEYPMCGQVFERSAHGYGRVVQGGRDLRSALGCQRHREPFQSAPTECRDTVQPDFADKPAAFGYCSRQ
jgi:hypothetical protein